MSNGSNAYRHTGTTDETVISTDRSRVIAIVPEGTTAGTVTLRNDNAANGDADAIKHIAAASLPQSGKQFSQRGVKFDTGITVQLSNAADVVLIVWAPKFS